jgi:hypothetical protein
MACVFLAVSPFFLYLTPVSSKLSAKYKGTNGVLRYIVQNGKVVVAITKEQRNTTFACSLCQFSASAMGIITPVYINVQVTLVLIKGKWVCKEILIQQGCPIR